MKISIVAFSDLKKCPYINPYVAFCRDNGIEHEVIYFNRSRTQQSADYPTYEIKWLPGKKKPLNFLHFRREAIKHLKASRPDFVIVLTTMPAVLLGGYLKRNFKKKYLIDIRDYTYENIAPYYMLEKSAIASAAMCVISSPGFAKFLPKADYTLCHNASAAYREKNEAVFTPKKDGKITIGYVGSIAYKENCRKLINLVLADERFAFHLYGEETGAPTLTKHVTALASDRIKAFGGYQPCDKVGIMQSVDILFNVYGNDRPLVLYALSNKLYDSYYMKLPVLTSANTSMSEELGDYAFDINFDDPEILNKLYDWYYAIDGESFARQAEDYLSRVFADQDKFYEKLKQTVLGTVTAAEKTTE